jgi:hypothetical protein
VPLTPKSSLPKIVFSWSNPLIETKKEETTQSELLEMQMRETKPRKVKKELVRRNILTYRGSLVSIKSSSSKKEAKFEESLIIVDYFHPDLRQLHKIEDYYGKN